jgi:hypothetical protein
MKNHRSILLTAAAMSMLSGVAALTDAAPALRSAGSGNNRRPTPPQLDTELQREIAAHNAEVDRRKAEKKAKKLAAYKEQA